MIYLQRDLSQFLLLMLFILVAFGCAFIVCLHGVTSYATDLATAETGSVLMGTGDLGASLLEFVILMRQLIGITLNGEPQQLEDLHVSGSQASGSLSANEADAGLVLSTFLLMSAFGCVVVVMLLSMVIARFSKSVYRVSESIDGAFKLKACTNAITEPICGTLAKSSAHLMSDSL